MSIICIRQDLRSAIGPADEARARALQLDTIHAYLYDGAKYIGLLDDGDHYGFWFDVPEHAGFGPEQTLARLASGLHFGHVVVEIDEAAIAAEGER